MWVKTGFPPGTRSLPSRTGSVPFYGKTVGSTSKLLLIVWSRVSLLTQTRIWSFPTHEGIWLVCVTIRLQTSRGREAGFVALGTICSSGRRAGGGISDSRNPQSCSRCNRDFWFILLSCIHHFCCLCSPSQYHSVSSSQETATVS